MESLRAGATACGNPGTKNKGLSRLGTTVRVVFLVRNQGTAKELDGRDGDVHDDEGVDEHGEGVALRDAVRAVAPRRLGHGAWDAKYGGSVSKIQ